MFAEAVAKAEMNIALNKEAFMSSLDNGGGEEGYDDYTAYNACDVNNDTSARTIEEEDPWWVVDLKETYQIRSVSVIAAAYGGEAPVIGIAMDNQFDVNTDVQAFVSVGTHLSNHCGQYHLGGIGSKWRKGLTLTMNCITSLLLYCYCRQANLKCMKCKCSEGQLHSLRSTSLSTKKRL